MSRAEKTLAQMKAHPLDWRIDALKSVAKAYGIIRRESGGSHVIFRHSNGTMLSVPSRRPIKPVYIMKFVSLVEEGSIE